MAKLLGFTGYSKLPKAQLVDRLAGDGPARVEPPAAAPRTPVTAPRDPVDDAAAEQASSHQAQPPTEAPSAAITDVASIAAHLRGTEAEEEGAAYLRAQHLDREGLLAVAAELQLTRVDRLSQNELEKRILKQAIGARRKF
ncbi:hypothetical protein [Nocardia sp. NPDC049526]|uniref:hypothetical protein n=1 Tax=Nocardia sp. NPDC049526 TaxID=3364316 RepID=UPI003799F01C